jgi:RNA polymerase sigma factor (sigma-70 family)
MRLWFRTPARTSQAGQPLPTPAKAARSSRAVLRLEACEDRTATSAVTTGPEPDSDAPPAHVGDLRPGEVPAESGEPLMMTGPFADPGPNSFGKSSGGQAAMRDGGTSTTTQSPPTTPGPVHGRLGGFEADQFDGPVTPQPQRAPRNDQPETTAGRSESQSTTSNPASPDQAVNRADQSSRTADQTGSTAAASTATATPTAAATTPHQATRTLTAAQRARMATADAVPVPAKNRVTSAVQPTATTTAQAQADTFHADLTDGTLLQRFVANREQAAFAALVQRHGGLVLGVCHRVLGDFHAAQDAVQATFLVLARKAGMLDRSGPLGGWLYKVAYHLALRSRGVAARQKLTERAADPADTTEQPAPESDLEIEEVRQAIREELEHLPEKYRAPLMLCYFDGRTHADAAREIGVPRGSMAKRIGEGLEFLRERLMDRGLTF